MVKTAAYRAGIEKNVHPHIFRHSMITHMAEKGLSAPFIQAQSRHKSLDMLQKYIHQSEQTVRVAYDSVFSKQKPADNEKNAQKPSVPLEKEKSAKADWKERLLELYLDGKLSDDKIGKLEKLPAMLDGRQDKDNAIQPEGYA